jgi:hypothetical protein
MVFSETTPQPVVLRLRYQELGLLKGSQTKVVI